MNEDHDLDSEQGTTEPLASDFQAEEKDAFNFGLRWVEPGQGKKGFCRLTSSSWAGCSLSLSVKAFQSNPVDERRQETVVEVAGPSLSQTAINVLEGSDADRRYAGTVIALIWIVGVKRMWGLTKINNTRSSYTGRKEVKGGKSIPFGTVAVQRTLLPLLIAVNAEESLGLPEFMINTNLKFVLPKELTTAIPPTSQSFNLNTLLPPSTFSNALDTTHSFSTFANRTNAIKRTASATDNPPSKPSTVSHQAKTVTHTNHQ